MQFPKPVSRPSSRSLLVAILLVATLVRLALLYVNYRENRVFFFQDTAKIRQRISDTSRPSQSEFGYEASNVAYALVCTDEGFASPFGGRTGPTAWVAPGTVALYAVPFALAGCFTPGSILLAFAMALAVSVVTTGLVYRAGCLFLNDRRKSLLAALLFAIGPGDTHLYLLPSQLDFNLPTFFLALILVATLEFVRRPTMPRMVGLASASALGALFQPNLVLCAGVALAFSLVRMGTLRRALPQISVMVAIHLVVLGPYVGFQRYRMGGWFFVKSNAPFELYQGNTDTARGTLSNTVFTRHHPSQNLQEFRAYREAGELAYVRAKFDQFVKQFDPIRFARTTLRRFGFYFFLYNEQWHDVPGVKLVAKRLFSAVPGLTLLSYLVVRRRRLRGADVFLYLYVGAYALPYLIAGYMTRYTVPIFPCIALLLADLLAGVFGVREGEPCLDGTPGKP